MNATEIAEKIVDKNFDWMLHGVCDDLIKDIASALSEVEAEKEMLQDILDSRPAINASLPESYIRWSQAIYSGEFVRSGINDRGKK